MKKHTKNDQGKISKSSTHHVPHKHTPNRSISHIFKRQTQSITQRKPHERVNPYQRGTLLGSFTQIETIHTTQPRMNKNHWGATLHRTTHPIQHQPRDTVVQRAVHTGLATDSAAISLFLVTVSKILSPLIRNMRDI